MAAEPSAQCNDNDNGQCDNTSESPSVCGLYLARSSIPNSGLGVFTGIPHEIGAVIAPPEIAHQLLVGFDDADPQLHASSEYHNSLVRQYVWSSFVSGGSFEASMVESLIPGIGMAANSFLPLINARSVMGSIDSAGVVGREHGSPGAGAFSSYHDMTYVAEMSLEAGSEIFADYGDSYFRDRPDTYGLIPLVQEFRRADEIMKGLWEALPNKDAPIGEEWQPFWNTVRNLVEDERTRNALPSSVSEIKRAATRGTPYNFLRGDNPRSLDWLQTNGLCIDTLEVKPSAIPHAGRGGFAKRSFATGETILPMPMMQISREALRIYKGEGENNSEIYSQQQLLNYCFGQKDSSMVLFPYSSTSSFVNHGGKHANAKIVWAKEGTDVTGFHRDAWMERSPDELVREGYTGLMMMLVATRPIVKGEEVTIDYGPEWQAAWEDHSARWSKNDDSSETDGGSPLSASELNESEDRIRTMFEESYESVGTAGHYRYDSSEDNEQMAIHVEPGQELDGHEALGLVYDEIAPEQQRKSYVAYIEERATVWRDHGGRATISGDNFRPCALIARKEGASPNEDLYTVRVFNSQNGAGHNEQIPTHREHYVKEVPRRAILFVDLPYTLSQHNESAFRHEIGFPDASDDMWPEAWKDLL